MAAKLIYQGQDIKMGYMILVENLNRRLGEPVRWVSLQIEGYTGDEGTEKCVLFTEKEMEKIQIVDLKGLDLKPGRFYPFEKGRFDGYLVSTLQYNVSTKTWYTVVYAMSKKTLNRAYARGLRNQEDLTVKSWWTDLKD